MELSEIIERNFTVSEIGSVMDDAGNEYRDENGNVNFINDKEMKKFDEFLEMINDDPDFNYTNDEFIEWVRDYDLV